MDFILERLMTQEAQTQARHALLAWQDVFSANDNRANPEWIDRVWMGLQSFATASANLSRLFGSTRGLDTVFGQVNLKPIGDRTFRDHFDHFDERIEQWVRARGGNVQDRAIRQEADVGMQPPPDQLRLFDPVAKRLIMRSRDGNTEEGFDLEPIKDCIVEIEREARRLLGR
jgi:hypothetical protein